LALVLPVTLPVARAASAVDCIGAYLLADRLLGGDVVVLHLDFLVVQRVLAVLSVLGVDQLRVRVYLGALQRAPGACARPARLPPRSSRWRRGEDDGAADHGRRKLCGTWFLTAAPDINGLLLSEVM